MQLQKPSIAAVIATALLTACGGGSDSNNIGTSQIETQATTAQTSTSDTAAGNTNASDSRCPADYKSISISQSTISGATFSMSVGKATFSFKTPKTGMPSIQICFGIATTPIVDGGLYMLSDTYEIKAYGPDGTAGDFLALTDRVLSIGFSIANGPAGVTFTDFSNKTHIYTAWSGGTLQMSNYGGHLIGTEGQRRAQPLNAGTYVVAYKP